MGKLTPENIRHAHDLPLAYIASVDLAVFDMILGAIGDEQRHKWMISWLAEEAEKRGDHDMLAVLASHGHY